MSKRRIVALGGGTGLYTLLVGLKEYDCDLSAIVNMTDDGGSTGVLRDEFGVLPPGDVRRCIVALSEAPERMRELFQYRFERGGLKGHSFGNLFITALRELTGSDAAAIADASRLLKVRGRVIPVTLDNRWLCAELENGQIIRGQTNIDIPKDHAGDLRIRRLFLDRPARANPAAVRVIRQADLIVLGPGDLFGSVIANLVVTGLPAAIRASRGRVVQVINLMTAWGETHDFAAHDFIRTLEDYLDGRRVDIALASSSRVPPHLARNYAGEHAYPVRIDKAGLRRSDTRFVIAPLAAPGNYYRHDSRRLARQIWQLLR